MGGKGSVVVMLYGIPAIQQPAKMAKQIHHISDSDRLAVNEEGCLLSSTF